MSDSKVSQNKSNEQVIEEVSLTLIANDPNKYNGKLVKVKGFLQLGFEANVIFTSKEAYIQGIDSNCLSIDITRKQMDSTYHHFNKTDVVISGWFDMNNKGHMNGFKGSLIHISNIQSAK